MEYRIKTDGNIITELLKVGEHTDFVKVWRCERGRITSDSEAFSDQLEQAGFMDDDFLNAVDSLLDAFFASDFMDLAELYEGY